MFYNTIDSFVGYIFYMLTLILSYKIPWRKWNWYAIISFTLLLGLKGNGIDYKIYDYAFRLLVNNNSSFFSSNYQDMLKDNMVGIEFGVFHLAAIKIISFFSKSSVWYFSILAFLQILGLDIFVRQFKGKSIKYLLIFFFFTTLMFAETFIAMRQMSAFMLYLGLIKFIAERNWKKYFIGCFILAAVHKSILIMVPFYFIAHLNVLKSIKMQFAIYILVVLLAPFLEKQFGSLLNLLFSGSEEFSYANYIQDMETFQFSVNRSALVYLFRFSTFFFLIANYQSFVIHYKGLGVVLYNFVFIGYILQELCFNLGIYRANYYFYYDLFAVLALMMHNIFCASKKNGFLRFFGCYITLLYFFWFGNCILKGASDCAPYVLSKDVLMYF